MNQTSRRGVLCLSRVLPFQRNFSTKGTGMRANEIRSSFLDFFERNGHERVESSPLIPNSNDDTLLFTNAGMVQFKDSFLGKEDRGYVKAVTSQKCVRAGGKHNDLENVGFTPRHHTFFEMLGNFSFGAYFKEEAIVMAHDYVDKELGLPKDRLRVTVFEDDDESEMLWRKIAGPNVPIHRLGKQDNFWSMGSGIGTPCGPCSEIFYDTELEVCDEDRYLEIWNLVFMQYQMKEDNFLEALPKPCVDTGMGLERIASVLQGCDSNFEIDTLAPLVEASCSITGQSSGFTEKVIADHLRASAFLIADGVVPSNVGRGYVLRRIIRRACGFAHRAGIEGPFMTKLLDTLEETFQYNGVSHFPQLKERRLVIEAVIDSEERIFFATLARGMGMLDKHIKEHNQLDPEFVFKMYDTYGFPTDLTATIGNSHGIKVDFQAVNKLQERQRMSSGAGISWAQDVDKKTGLVPKEEWRVFPEFTGYTSLNEVNAKVLAVAEGPSENTKWVAISPCPFYGESGGQSGDRGSLIFENTVHKVEDTVKPYKGGIALLVRGGVGPLELNVGDFVEARVDVPWRNGCAVHHTATHLLNAALRHVLGEQILQAGSMVTCNRLRFDFTHPSALSKEQITEVESFMNEYATRNGKVQTELMAIEDAKDEGALMMFSEKYDSNVRVVTIANDGDGGHSKELCGGTHVPCASLVFPIRIVSDQAVAAGTRRIEAAAGRSAVEWMEQRERALLEIASVTKCTFSQPEKIVEHTKRMKSRLKQTERELQELREESLKLPRDPVAMNDSIFVHKVPDLTPDEPKLTTKSLQQFGSNVLRKDPEKVHVLLCGTRKIAFVVQKDGNLNAGSLLRSSFGEFSSTFDIDVKGGGGQHFAQGVLSKPCPTDWNAILECVNKLV